MPTRPRPFVRCFSVRNGSFALLAVLASSFAGCAPGEVDCERAPSACAPARVDGGDTPRAPDGGVTGDASGKRDTAPSPGAPGMLGAACTIGGVTMTTVAEVESMLLKPRCGSCHNAMGVIAPTDLSTARMHERLLGASAKGARCPTTKLVDGSKPGDSLLLIKLMKAPRCPDGSSAGDVMPPGAGLPAAEVKCLEAYVNAIASVR